MDYQEFNQLINKIDKIKRGGQIDLSLEEDLSIAVMNLISLEEHFFFTAEKTGKKEYFELLNETRMVRRDLMSKMINKTEGEVWCVSKHLLSATMRLIEVGTKYLSKGKKDEAEKTFAQAYKIYSLFWGIRLKLVSLPELKETSGSDTNKPWGLEDIMKKLVDCCDEGQKN